jgi:hypothetical protein
MRQEITLYHYTKKENVPTILRNGLLNRSKFNVMGSKLRSNASYLLLSPAHDVMGYRDDEDFECLVASVDPAFCVVADMDLISAAYVNFVQEQTNESLYDYRKLVALYDTTTVPISGYINGMFRAPEVIVRRLIPPGHIRSCQPSGGLDAYAGNRAVYHDAAVKKLLAGGVEKIASNEDATGHISTYKVTGRDEFFTIEDAYAG